MNIIGPNKDGDRRGILMYEYFLLRLSSFEILLGDTTSESDCMSIWIQIWVNCPKSGDWPTYIESI